METAFLTGNSTEWKTTWAALFNLTEANVEEPDTSNQYENWQYMVTVEHLPGCGVHQFRHRCAPRINRRVYLNIDASRGWHPSDEKEPEPVAPCWGPAES